jgi:hypothetical protein
VLQVHEQQVTAREDSPTFKLAGVAFIERIRRQTVKALESSTPQAIVETSGRGEDP